MKKKYLTPEMEIFEIYAEDVIMTSSEEIETGGEGGWEGDLP